jgi:hypothetical protein
MINRTLEWAYPEPNNTIQVKNQTGPNADLGIAMNSTVANGTINLDVKVKFDANMTGLKLVVYALENNLIYNQTNYTSYYGGVSTIQNFEHDNVLRASLTNILGDAITSNTNDGDIYSRNFTVNVPSNVANASNLSFVAFVIGTDNKAINVRAALPNVNQTFQENQ